MLDLKLSNARIHTLGASQAIARTLGVLHGRIVGLDQEVDSLPSRVTLDCGGAVVVPGFGDAHNHMAWFGQSLSELDLSGCSTLTELYDAVAVLAARLEPEAWVIGSGYDDTVMGAHPERGGLDRVAGGRPVWLKHRSGHMCTVNSEVLRRTGILDGAGVLDRGVRIPDGGTVVMDHGSPSGLLQEQAQKLVSALVIPYPVSDLADAIGRASNLYAAEGLTHVTEAGIGAGWIGRSPIELAAYTAARQQGALKTRVQLMVSSDALHSLDTHSEDDMTFGLDLGITTGFGDDWIRVGAMKIFMDGSLIGRTAAVTEPYADRGHDFGRFQLPVEQLEARIVKAHSSGWTVAAHAIGDHAVDVALDAFEEAQRQHPRPQVRHRIEHAGIVRPDQIARFGRLGITPVPQARFLHEVGDTMAQAVGPGREAWLYRHRSFLENGIRVPGSSDRPVAAGAPLLGMQSMVQRRTSSGAVVGYAEAVTAAQALRAYTVDAAWAAGEEALRGTLTAGKLADLVLLSDHPAGIPAKEIGGIKVLATFVQGECVHGTQLVDTLRT